VAEPIVKPKEIIAAVFAFGEWHDVIRGTFRRAEGLALCEEAYTWLEGSPNDAYRWRFYARDEEVRGLMTVHETNTGDPAQDDIPAK
jgi:hypothetical protein